MSAEGNMLSQAPAERPTAARRAASWWAAAERWLEWAGDRLNPILVKESRQALKSRQFTITFGLVLICAWVWSILGMLLIGPQIYYGASGPTMFYGYYLILAFPLSIIVPFGAFRSLAAEQEDRTYELLSISTLNPRQMVGGKLGSAALQMIVYLSAVSPCLAFTYMLRGIDFPTILMILLYTVLFSLGLSLIGLMAATLTTERHWQVVLSVLLIGGLFLAMWGASALAFVLLFEEPAMPFEDPEFWQANAAIQTAYWSYFALLFFAAAAQLTFPSDNRSTRLRVVMMLQSVLLAGWMGWIWIVPERGDDEILAVFLILVAIHWYVMGALMTGESPELSSRVRRGLPQSFLGRVFLTWFNPGPGTGYLFAVSSMAAALILVVIAVICHQTLGLFDRTWGGEKATTILAVGLLLLAYMTIYLGLGLLVIRALRKVYPVGMLLTGLIHFLLVLLGFGLPWIIHLSTPALRRSDDYSLLHITDPLWTPIYLLDRWRAAAAETAVLVTVVPLAALVVLVLNLPSLAREVRQLRVGRPQRVEEEDAELAALQAPPQPTRISPWDEIPPGG
jgi:hypothetical protein